MPRKKDTAKSKKNHQDDPAKATKSNTAKANTAKANTTQAGTTKPAKNATKGQASSDAAGKLKACVKVKARHILCEKLSDVLKAQEKLKSGISFSKVAEECSEDKAKVGGALGFITRQSVVGAFAEVAFSLPESTVLNPIYNPVPLKTVHGYHIIMVEERQ